MRTESELNRIAYEIRGCGLRVHRKLGPGCFESAYSPCFAYELTKSKLEFRSEVPLTLCYEGIVVPDAYVSDYIIEGCVIGELKALAQLAQFIRGRWTRIFRSRGVRWACFSILARCDFSTAS